MQTLIGIVLWLLFVPGAAALGMIAGVWLAHVCIQRFDLSEPENMVAVLVCIPACMLPIVYAGSRLLQIIDGYVRSLL